MSLENQLSQHHSSEGEELPIDPESLSSDSLYDHDDYKPCSSFADGDDDFD